MTTEELRDRLRQEAEREYALLAPDKSRYAYHSEYIHDAKTWIRNREGFIDGYVCRGLKTFQSPESITSHTLNAEDMAKEQLAKMNC